MHKLYLYIAFGNFEDDSPYKILSSRIAYEDGVNGKKISQIQLLVEWHLRHNGSQSKPTYFNNKVLRNKCPLLLLDFYESKLKIPENLQ